MLLQQSIVSWELTPELFIPTYYKNGIIVQKWALYIKETFIMFFSEYIDLLCDEVLVEIVV